MKINKILSVKMNLNYHILFFILSFLIVTPLKNFRTSINYPLKIFENHLKFGI